jgi:hypothetical protein
VQCTAKCGYHYHECDALLCLTPCFHVYHSNHNLYIRTILHRNPLYVILNIVWFITHKINFKFIVEVSGISLAFSAIPSCSLN